MRGLFPLGSAQCFPIWASPAGSFVRKPGCQLPHSVCPSHQGVCLWGQVVEDTVREKAIETLAPPPSDHSFSNQRERFLFFQMLGACRAYWGLRKWKKEKEQKISLHPLSVRNPSPAPGLEQEGPPGGFLCAPGPPSKFCAVLGPGQGVQKGNIGNLTASSVVFWILIFFPHFLILQQLLHAFCPDFIAAFNGRDGWTMLIVFIPSHLELELYMFN